MSEVYYCVANDFTAELRNVSFSFNPCFREESGNGKELDIGVSDSQNSKNRMNNWSAH